ncbi:hypothetical protein CoNPh26_CDS0111 [Staphylococcus phage S-CoN_Ph26]|nr:hypothetical protein CoNPh26_CDS0111 [Staphylococcus phage S-CoN_Ph26]
MITFKHCNVNCSCHTKAYLQLGCLAILSDLIFSL